MTSGYLTATTVGHAATTTSRRCLGRARRVLSGLIAAAALLALYDQKGKKVGTFKAPLSVGGPGPLRLAGRGLYRGWLEFRLGGGAAVQTVNALHLEDYVRGVVSYEMPSSWSGEALKTQA